MNAVYYKDSGDQYRPHCDGECGGGRYYLGARLATGLSYCQVGCSTFAAPCVSRSNLRPLAPSTPSCVCTPLTPPPRCRMLPGSRGGGVHPLHPQRAQGGAQAATDALLWVHVPRRCPGRVHGRRLDRAHGLPAAPGQEVDRDDVVPGERDDREELGVLLAKRVPGGVTVLLMWA